MIQSTKPALLLAAGLLASMGGLAVAQNGTNQTGSTTSGQNSTLSSADKMFIMKADQSNLAEIKTSQMALDKASKQGLKDFAQHMINDHTTAENDLKQLAQDKNYTLPSEPDAKNRAAAAKLMKLSGSAFDSMYVKVQHNGHVATIALFKKEIANGANPDVKAYAQKYLPTIQGHLQDLNSLTGGSPMRSGSTSGSNGSSTSGSSSQR